MFDWADLDVVPPAVESQPLPDQGHLLHHLALGSAQPSARECQNIVNISNV